MLMTATFSSCKKFVELGAPPTQVVLEDAFKTDASATSATLGMYTFVNASAAMDTWQIIIFIRVYQVMIYSTMLHQIPLYRSSRTTRF